MNGPTRSWGRRKTIEVAVPMTTAAPHFKRQQRQKKKKLGAGAKANTVYLRERKGEGERARECESGRQC